MDIWTLKKIYYEHGYLPTAMPTRSSKVSNSEILEDSTIKNMWIIIVK